MKQDKLKDLTSHITDGEHSSVKDCACGEFYLLSNKNIINGNIIFNSSDRKIAEETFKRINKRTQLEVGDVVVSTVGTIGKVAVIQKVPQYDFQRSVGIIKCDKTKILPEFLFYYLSIPAVQERLNKLSKGAVQKCLFIGDLEDLIINYPQNVDEQRKLIAPLMEIDGQIQRNNEVVHNLQVLGNAIYGQNAKLQTETFNIQDACKPIWGNCPLGDNILENKTQYAIPYASGAGDIDNRISVKPKAFTDKPTRIVNQKDVCMSVAGTIGKIAIAADKICIGRAMLGFSSPELYGYIYFGLNTHTKALQKKATGAIQKIINSDHLSIVNLPIYTDSVVLALNEIVDQMLSIDGSTTKLIALKETLLPLLINGQLSI